MPASAWVWQCPFSDVCEVNSAGGLRPRCVVVVVVEEIVVVVV